MKKLALFLAILLTFMAFPMMLLAAESEGRKVAIDEEVVIGETKERLAPIEGEENLIINGSFEEVDENNIAKYWTSRCWNLDNETGATIVGDAHTGKNAVKLVGGEIPANYPFVLQDFSTMGRAVYQMSVWVKKDGGNSATTVKLEFWPEMLPGADCVQQSNTFSLRDTGGAWQEVLYNFYAPFTAKSVSLLVRLENGDGEIAYFDDVSVYMVKPPEAIQMETDQNFYYEEMKEGFVTARVLTNFFKEAIGGSVEFFLLDGEKVLKTEEVKLDENSEAVFHYTTDVMTELKKEYILKGVLKTPDGDVIMETTEPIYRFNRPKWLNPDGTFQPPGEEPFMPVLVYHAFGDYYQKCNEGGITLMQGSDGMQDNEYNIKQVIVLYQNGKDARDPINLQNTIDIVTKLKDDPNVYGWAVMDEPHLRMTDPHDALREAYRVIRTIDDNHPVYICEATPGHYRETMKNVDVLCIDPYMPGSTLVANAGKMNTTHVYELNRQARQAGDMIKPVISLNQAFQWYGYLPTAKDERHMIYQAFMGGAGGIGYYSMSDPIKIDGKRYDLYAIPDSDLWEGIVAWGENERDDTFKHFVFREYGGFNHYVGEDFMYHGYIKDNYLYMLVMNQSITDTIKVEVPLVSFDGSITIDNYFGEYLYGGEGKNIKGNSSMMPVTLEPNAAVILKVSPRRATDFASLDQDAFWEYFDAHVSGEFDKGPHFTDLEGYDWASEAIEALYKEGIINEKAKGEYEPATKITRGDFAMFLINALGLDSDMIPMDAENFDDVDSEAEYARAIAVGKYRGVLNGVGDNKFNPEAEITRQDLMTICFPGIEVSKKGEAQEELSEDSFPDWGDVADYAKASISAMVHYEIVKGNADGTLNPKGNTTRAEAAVIMQRIKNMD